MVKNRVWCWGWDNELQTSDAPTGSKYVDVALGNRFSCALANTGRVDCWGRDTEGQASPPSTRYDQLEASYALACGRTNDGEIECWGSIPLDNSAMRPPTRAIPISALAPTMHAPSMQTMKSVDTGDAMPPVDAPMITRPGG